MSLLDLLLLGVALFMTVDSVEARAQIRRLEERFAEALRVPNVECLTDDLYYGPIRLIDPPVFYDQDEVSA